MDGDRRPVVPYHGGKSRLAAWIVAQMPSHRVYLEPFAGSAAVLLAKPRSTHEVLNDIDGNVVTFYRVLRERPEQLERACRLSPYARDEYRSARLDEPGVDDLERARRWWVRVCQSFAHTGSPTTGWSVSTRRGSNDARTTAARLERFHLVAARLAGVAIENRDARALIVDHADADTVIYADPPYLGSTRSMNAHRRSSGDYTHEFATNAEHEDLAEILRATPATVLLSGYPSSLYERLYGDWTRLERRVPRRAAAHRSAGGQTTEVLWINRSVHYAQDPLFMPANGQNNTGVIRVLP